MVEAMCQAIMRVREAIALIPYSIEDDNHYTDIVYWERILTTGRSDTDTALYWAVNYWTINH